MASLNCDQFQDSLQAWLDGECSSDARSHLRDCPHCRALVEDFDALHSAARSLASLDMDPPEYLWPALRAQLLKEGLIHDARKPSWLRGLFISLPRPALASAYVAALVAVAFALSGPVHRRVNDYRWLQHAQSAELASNLDTAAKSVASIQVDPVVRASLQENLAIVDNYIALCEKSVREEPQNEMARDYLYGAYQQKADLLAQMAERGEYSR
jgi:anti-sigma factor RsiW